MRSNAPLAIGLMSGTSADAVSAALVRFHGHSFELLGVHHHPYPASVAELVRRGRTLQAPDLSQLDVLVGRVFADAALKLLKKTKTPASRVAVIGSHGQTVYHGPDDRVPKGGHPGMSLAGIHVQNDKVGPGQRHSGATALGSRGDDLSGQGDHVPNTLQIGDPDVIAERLGVDVVSHFRQRDVALGGQGAPLIPYFDRFFFGEGPVRAMQNIGGISNVTVVGKTVAEPLAFDTGPGNCLMDAAVRAATNGRETHDHNGARAKRGRLDMNAVTALMADPYYQLPPPKSTGLERFNLDMVRRAFGADFAARIDDVLATLMYVTALTIQESYRRHVFGRHNVTEVVVSGGGALNRTLMTKLGCLFAPIPVVSSEKYGLPVQAKEPVAFAFFAWRFLHGLVNHEPSCTGASAARRLGRLTPGRA